MKTQLNRTCDIVFQRESVTKFFWKKKDNLILFT
jgi:hypothetical protein